MDLNEQMDQNAADFSQIPPAPAPLAQKPGTAPASSEIAEVSPGIASKSVSKFQVFAAVGLLIAVIGVFYYLLTRPKSQRPKGYVPPPAIPTQNVPKNK